jgi:glycosyltransferase involved in cell wall biosynthesis
MQLLEEHGHKTAAFARKHFEHVPSEYENYFPEDIKTDSISFSWAALRTASEIIYSGEAKRALHKLLKQSHPDIAHAHNIYGRLTSSVLDLLAKMDIPIIMTLHDYKLICPNYKMLNKGETCEACRGRNFYMSVRNRCHKSSLLASLVYAFEAYFCQWMNKYSRNVNIFIAPSLFMKKKLVEYGWPKDRIVYLPNFIKLPTFDPVFSPEKYFLYLGRLSSEKGIATLIDSFISLNPDRFDIRLQVVGEGHLRRQLEEKGSQDPRIQFMGYLSGNKLKETTRKALAVIVPSEWYENAPISILEAFAYGKPVIGSRIGGIPEMIDEEINGYLFDPGNADDLREKLELVLSMPDAHISKMGQAARQKVEREYNAELHYERLMAVYHRALSET